VEKLPNPFAKIACFRIRYANKIGGMVENQTMKKLNLSAPLDESLDLFIALIKLITISLTHHNANKVIVRYLKISISKTYGFMSIVSKAFLFCKEVNQRFMLLAGGQAEGNV
jgi:hypothetical protein